MIRAFIAIELPPEVTAALARAQEALGRDKEKGVRWVSPEGIHLTLKFLGNVEESQLPQLEATLAEAATIEDPFTLQLGALGAFPNARSPRVLWVGVAGEAEKLARLQQAVEGKVSPLGFPPEERAFSPHLTLGRVRPEVKPPDRRMLGEKLAQASVGEGPSFPVNALSLMQSTLTPQGARYQARARFPLGMGHRLGHGIE